MQQTRRSFFHQSRGAVRSLPFVFGALVACSTTPDMPAADDPPDLASGRDGSTPPPTVFCQPTVTTWLPEPLAELHAATPLVIEVAVGDSGGLTKPHPVKVAITTADGTLVQTLVDEPKPLGKLALAFTPAANSALHTGALQLTAEVGCPASDMGQPSRATATIYVVRLGAIKLAVHDEEGGGRVPLMYHALDPRANSYFPIPETLATSSIATPAGEPELDQPDGSPRQFPAAPWADLATPPVDEAGAVIESGYTIPLSLKSMTPSCPGFSRSA